MSVILLGLCVTSEMQCQRSTPRTILPPLDFRRNSVIHEEYYPRGSTFTFGTYNPEGNGFRAFPVDSAAPTWMVIALKATYVHADAHVVAEWDNGIALTTIPHHPGLPRYPNYSRKSTNRISNHYVNTTAQSGATPTCRNVLLTSIS